MATRRRDTAPRKDKTEASSSSNTPNTLLHLKPTPNVPSKTISPPLNNGPTAHRINTPKTSLRPATRSSTSVKKPTPLNTTTARKTPDKTPLPTHILASPSTRPRDKTPSRAQKTSVSTNPSARPQNKTPSPAQKKHVSTISSLRPRDKTPLPAQNTHISPPQPSSFPRKSTASQKVGSGKNRKPVNKDVGKHTSSHATPVNLALKTSNVCTQELETEKIPTSATTEQTTESFQQTFENTDIYENLPEVDTLLEDQESFTFETVEQIIQVVSDDERDIIGFIPKDQEKPTDIAQTEAEKDHEEREEEVKIVTVEPTPVLEQQQAPVDIKTQESEDKPCIEEKLEEVVHEKPSTNNIITSVADELPEDASKEKEVEEVVVVVEKKEEKEKATDKKDEVAGQSEAIEPVETKVQEVVEKQKQEPDNKAQKRVWPRVKKDVVSNDTIEETASKLRDQRRNRVRALAGAFESVISSQ